MLLRFPQSPECVRSGVRGPGAQVRFDSLGGTPLVRLERLSEREREEIWVKWEDAFDSGLRTICHPEGRRRWEL